MSVDDKQWATRMFGPFETNSPACDGGDTLDALNALNALNALDPLDALDALDALVLADAIGKPVGPPTMIRPSSKDETWSCFDSSGKRIGLWSCE